MRAKIRIVLWALLAALVLHAQISHAYNNKTNKHTKNIRSLAREVNKKGPDDMDYFENAFPRDDEIKADERSSGSLWVDSYSSRMYNNLNRASRIGDMVTVMIEEETQGKDNAETKTDRKSNTLFGITNFFGAMAQIPASLLGADPSSLINANHESKHEGKGTTKRSSTLLATITARVVRVLKNGDLMVRGQKNITINKEEQVMTIEGFIRPYDISSTNTISSTMVADARISLSGFGALSNQQKPGWLQQIFDKILPF